MNAVTTIEPANNERAYRASTDAAGMCREIVIATATTIGGKSYVGVEGWQAIAVAHGCAASADNVERVTDEGMTGFKAIGIVRRMSDGVEIARAEGFLGDDETTWTKRPVYARRAMVQTRAISRACRSAFAHVVVMMKANLSTTPAEEVPYGGFGDGGQVVEQSPPPRKKPEALKGPIKTRAGVRDAYGKFLVELAECTDSDALEAFIVTSKPLIDQINDESEYYRDGDGGEHKGLTREIADARERVANDISADSVPY